MPHDKRESERCCFLDHAGVEVNAAFASASGSTPKRAASGVPSEPGVIESANNVDSKRKRDDSSRSDHELPEGYGLERDENFSYIAGHTAAGFPFALTWEEYDPAEDVADRDDPDALVFSF